jgi:hypothetical protein
VSHAFMHSRVTRETREAKRALEFRIPIPKLSLKETLARQLAAGELPVTARDWSRYSRALSFFP